MRGEREGEDRTRVTDELAGGAAALFSQFAKSVR